MSGEVQNVNNKPSWCQQRTALQKILTLTSIVGVITIIILSVFLASVNSKNAHNVCVTPGCTDAASYTLNLLDQSVNPCDDFYNFACGNFIKNTHIPDGELTVYTSSLLNDKVLEQLRALLNEEGSSTESKPFTLAKKLFKACMNESLIEKRGMTPLITILDKLGGWPVVKGDQWNNRTTWTWVEAVKDFRKIGFSIDYIFDFNVRIDPKNTTSRTIRIEQATLGLTRADLIEGLRDDAVRAYYRYMVDMAVLYGADRFRAHRELKESLKFEIALANISLPKEKQVDSFWFYNPMSLRELQEKYNYVRWVEYINALLPAGVSVNENEVIAVSVPQYFEDLGNLLLKTPIRVIANYMMWRITAFSSSFLTEELRKRQLAYNLDLSGVEELEPRWKECTIITNGKNIDGEEIGMPISVGALYVRKHFKQNTKRAVLEIVNGIRSEFERMLATVPWMDSNTRAAALTKAKAITAHIGYPDELMDDKKLEEHYEGLEINPDTYLESVLRINVFTTDWTFGQLRKAVNKTDWVTHSTPTTVAAFYTKSENSIEFPAALLQGHYFSIDRPTYMNYGAIGYSIGHEIMHGFDNEGRLFDVDGHLADWWGKETESAFLSRTNCIIEQYGNYTDSTTGLKLDGIRTQGENIADNGGFKESYAAYKRWVEEYGPEPKLPGLDYTPEQLFWISAAQTWCSVSRIEFLKHIISTGPHPPPQFRVLGTFSNIHDFGNDFNCPIGSMMNPVNKCEVW